MNYDECQRWDCDGSRDVEIVTWNGFVFEECFRHAAESERDGVAKLERLL